MSCAYIQGLIIKAWQAQVSNIVFFSRLINYIIRDRRTMNKQSLYKITPYPQAWTGIQFYFSLGNDLINTLVCSADTSEAVFDVFFDNTIKGFITVIPD